MTPSKRFLLRLDPALFDALRRWAADDLRSINAQIEYLLAERARRAGRLSSRRATRGTDSDPPDAPGDEDPEGQPSSLMSASTRRAISSRVALTSPTGRPAGSGSSQSM
jgi:hypothetical protein